jgi:hypothetical protein
MEDMAQQDKRLKPQNAAPGRLVWPVLFIVGLVAGLHSAGTGLSEMLTSVL